MKNDWPLSKEDITEAQLHSLRVDVYKSLLQGLVIRGEFNFNEPHADVLRCWNAAKPAAEVTEKA